MKNQSLLVIAALFVATANQLAAEENAFKFEIQPEKNPAAGAALNRAEEDLAKKLIESLAGLFTAGQKEQPASPPAGAPPVIKLGEGGEKLTITIDGDGKVTQSGGEAHAEAEKGPWLGIGTEPVSEALRDQLSLAKEEGLVISHVAPGSPAAAAGLAPHDVLLRLDDQIIVEFSQLRKLIAMKKPGDSVKLVFVHKAARQEAMAKLIEHEIEAAASANRFWIQPAPGQPRQEQEGHDRKPQMEQRLRELLQVLPGLFNSLGTPPAARKPGE